MQPLVRPPTIDPGLPRYVAEEEFPPYRFLPGLAPHPTHDRDGHSFGREVAVEGSFDESHWNTCRTWLRGIDLFNHGYFWESHEAWEALWKERERGTPVRLLLQGLIQCAAAHIQWLLGSSRGHERLKGNATDKLVRFLASTGSAERVFGLDLPPWIEATHAYWRQPRDPFASLLPHPPLRLEPFPE